ncbi:MAG: tRNA (adenosine(37)-N6)-threonylcarbamoyltransferase complex dimerization subunit type 1 TsaB [Betaproteobacteria bacterium]|nr:tRNA (adenosine(37)-N6)-threonylcarbamoyltransferase complex dimerization subunit type 1 TsaB [Betaproteobacteria bacterium]
MQTWDPRRPAPSYRCGQADPSPVDPVILAIEVSVDRCSVGMLAGGVLSWRESVDGRAAESILPLISDEIEHRGLDRSALDAIAFSAGPGGFTGLRVACGIAQGLGWALDRPLLAVDSLAAVAWQTRSAQIQQVVVAVDARMGEVYAGLYVVDPEGTVQTLRAPWLATPQALAQSFALELGPLNSWLAAGDAFRVYEALVQPGAGHAAQDSAMAEPSEHAWCRVETARAPRADAIAAIGARLWRQGQTTPAGEASPVYVRDKVALDVDEQRALRASRDTSSRKISNPEQR